MVLGALLDVPQFGFDRILLPFVLAHLAEDSVLLECLHAIIVSVRVIASGVAGRNETV
jgi:hypothetical protein